MKKYLVILCIIIRIDSASAQTFSKSEIIRLKSNSQVSSFMTDSRGMYCISFIQGKSSQYLYVVDTANLKLRSKTEINLKKSNEIISKIYIHEHALLFAVAKNNIDQINNFLYYLHLDLNTLQVSNREGQAVENFKNLASQVFLLNYDKYVDEALYNQALEASKSEHGGHQMKKIWEPSDTLSGYKIKVQVLHDESVLKNQRHFTEFQIQKENDKQVKKTVLIKWAEKRIIAYHLVKMNNGNIRFYGKYCSQKNNLLLYGYFQAILSPELNFIHETQFMEIFSSDLLLESLPYMGVFDHSAAQLMQLDLRFLNNAHTQTEDLLIVTNAIQFEQMASQDEFRSTKLVRTTKDISILQLKPDGSLVYKTIPLKQEDINSKFYSSLSVAWLRVEPSVVRIFFFDHKSNLKNEDNGKKPKACQFDKNTELVYCDYNLTNGSYGPKTLLHESEVYYTIFPIEMIRITYFNNAFFVLQKDFSEFLVLKLTP